jgi:hypothetical protein
MYLDKRKEKRAVYSQQPHGKLQVLLGEKRIEVYSVKDASQSGLQLEVGNRVDSGDNVLIRYLTKEVDIKVNGTVMWSSSSRTDSNSLASSKTCTIGIRLASPSILQTFW